jgi:hypothetical protein
MIRACQRCNACCGDAARFAVPAAMSWPAGRGTSPNQSRRGRRPLAPSASSRASASSNRSPSGEPASTRGERLMRQSPRVRAALSNARASAVPPASRRHSRIAAHSAPEGNSWSVCCAPAQVSSRDRSANCENVKMRGVSHNDRPASRCASAHAARTDAWRWALAQINVSRRASPSKSGSGSRLPFKNYLKRASACTTRGVSPAGRLA